MLLFRDETQVPAHQKDREECEHYSSYLATLIDDYNKRCGYCNDLNSYRIRSFAIDHFVPRNPKDFTHSIKPNYYFNLVYACNYCNGAKSNKFPTKDPNKPNDGKIGFIIPTDPEYGKIFCRDKFGTIYASNDNVLGEYIIEELNLKNPIHSLMWRIERIMILEKEVSLKLKNNPDTELKEQHYELMTEVIDIVNNIFSKND